MCTRAATYALFIATFFLLLLSGCSGPEAQSPPRDQDLLNRMIELEQKVQSLEEQHSRDIAALREDLKNILAYLQIALDNLTRTGDLEKELGDVGESARRSFREKLKELLDLSQEMIDRLEKDLEQSGPGQQQ